MHRPHPSRFVAIVALGIALASAPAFGQPPAPQSGPTEVMGMAVLLTPEVVSISVKEVVGLPEQAAAEVLTWDRVYALALVAARGGRARPAESLVPGTLAERARGVGVGDFERFRRDLLAGPQGAGGFFSDPSGAYLAVLRRLQAIDNARYDAATLESLRKLVEEALQGESAGLLQQDFDLLSEAMVRRRGEILRETADLRDDLDELKVGLGLSPHAAVLPDRRTLAAFRDVDTAIDQWARRPDRNLAELPRIVDRLPALGNVVLGGRPIASGPEPSPGQLEDVLRDAARRTIAYRTGAGGPGSVVGEAAIELRVRRRVRRLIVLRRDYEVAKRALVLAVRLTDESLDRLFHRMAGDVAPRRGPEVQHLVAAWDRRREVEDRLVELWSSFVIERLALYRDVGSLPYDNWEAFYADLSARRPGPEPPGK